MQLQLELAALAFTLCSLTVQGSSLRRAASPSDTQNNDDHRNLQFGDGGCDFLGAFLPGSYTCTCGLNLEIVNLGFSFTCTATTALCFPLCITPSISGNLALINNVASLEICNNGFDNSGGLNGPAFTLPPFCIELGGRTNTEVFGDAHESKLNKCKMNSQGETCNSCEICDGGLGYKFNCTNVDEHLVQSTCLGAHLLSGFNPKDNVEFQIQLDDIP